MTTTTLAQPRMAQWSAALVRSPTLRFILKRVLQAIPIIILISFFVFAMLNSLPGGTVAAILGQNATPRLEHALTIELGLNRPFFMRYFHWLRLAVHGNFGVSLLNNVPVAHTIGLRLPVSAEIGILAFVEAFVFALPVAIAAAKNPRGLIDRINLGVSMFGFSCPTFVTALVAVIIFAIHLHWFPAIGFTPISAGLWPNLRSVVLPSTSIAFAIFCGYTRILRADLVDQINGEDYIITARAKGVSAWICLIRHALRNAIFNIVTIAVLNIGQIVGGAVLVEQIFNIPGMGLLLIDSIQLRDVVTVQAEVTLIACAVVGANLLSDIIYTLLDPRVRHGSHT